jgi:hypothetical protein
MTQHTVLPTLQNQTGYQSPTFNPNVGNTTYANDLNFGGNVGIPQITGADAPSLDLSAFGGQGNLVPGAVTPPGTTPPGPPSDVNWATGLTALTGVGNLALGAETLNLGQDQYASSLAQYNQNVSNQAQLVNADIEAYQRNYLVNTGQAPTNPDGSVDYNALGDITAAYVDQQGVSGTPIS